MKELLITMEIAEDIFWKFFEPQQAGATSQIIELLWYHFTGSLISRNVDINIIYDFLWYFM